HLVIFRHEAVQFGIAEDRAFPPQSLRKQESRRILHVQSRRMELDKLHIADFRSGTMGHGYAVGGSDGRISSVAVDLSATACGQQNRRTSYPMEFAVRRDQLHPTNTA